MKMELIEGSETSAIRTQTPGNYPKENILRIEHGEITQKDCPNYPRVTQITQELPKLPKRITQITQELPKLPKRITQITQELPKLPKRKHITLCIVFRKCCALRRSVTPKTRL